MADHFPALTPAPSGYRAALAVIALTGALAACSEPSPESSSADVPYVAPAMPRLDPPNANTEALAANALSRTTCDRTTTGFRRASERLTGAVTALTTHPGRDTLKAAREQWLVTVEAWGSALPCLAAPLTAAAERRHSLRLARTAAGPALAGFIDAMPGYPGSGLVHDVNVELSLDALLQQHQVTDDGEIALGLFALEVLLFGVTERVPEDFAALPANLTSEQAAATTRRSSLTALMASDLQTQSMAWDQYWQQHQTSRQLHEIEPEPAALLHAQVSARHAATRHLVQLAEAQMAGQPGQALHVTHDHALQHAVQKALADWWLAPEVQTWVTTLGLSPSAWQQVASDLATASAEGTDWQSSAQRAMAAQQQLTLILAALAAKQ